MTRVLLVEDDRILRRACDASLRSQGFDVVLATDGEEALRVVGEAPAPDLIVLDLLLPRMLGIDVLRTLKAEAATQTIPVVVLSSRAADRRRAEELGAAAFYMKANLSLKELAADVARLVRGGQDG